MCPCRRHPRVRPADPPGPRSPRRRVRSAPPLPPPSPTRTRSRCWHRETDHHESYLPVRKEYAGSRPAGPGPHVRRQRVGPLGAHARARPAPVRPGVPQLVPGRVGGPREDPDRRRRAARGQPRSCHPVGCPGDHARHRDGAGVAPATAWPTTSSAPCPSWARCGTGWAGFPRIPTTPTGCCTTRGSWCWCSPRGPRAPPRPSTSATSCAGSVGAASSRSPCGRACRSCRSPWSAPRSRCRRWCGSPRSPRRSACRTCR